MDTPHQKPLPIGRTRARHSALVAAAAVAALAAGGAYTWAPWRPATAPVRTTEAVRWGNLTVVVESSGPAQPVRRSELSFAQGGAIAAILVRPGERVAAGQPLAHLDDAALRRTVEQAAAGVREAEAQLALARGGQATPEQLAAARANVVGAQARLEQVRTGGVTPADLAEAQARLDAAQARLDALLNPAPADLSAAETRLAEAQAQLQTVRDERSRTKTAAHTAMLQAAERLTQAQSTYATARANWEDAQATGADPLAPTTRGADGRAVRNTLSDGERRRYYDAFVQAGAALRSAEQTLAQAEVDYDAARRVEATSVPLAEQQLADAAAQLSALRSPASAELRQAEAAVAEARARLAQLRAGGAPALVAEAQAAVEHAQAQLDALTAPASPAEVAVAEARLARARLDLQAARADLQAATLTAPFAGTVAEVAGLAGGRVAAGAPVVTVVATEQIELDLALTEYDVQQVAVGQAAEVSFEAIPDRTFAGEVVAVALAGTKSGNVTTYRVVVRFAPGDAGVRLGMTGDARIVVATRENAIQVPNQALAGAGEVRALRVHRQGAPQAEAVLVRTGLTDGVMTEVLSCMPGGAPCLSETDRVEIATAPGGDPALAPDGAVLITAPADQAGADGAPVIRPITSP